MTRSYSWLFISKGKSPQAVEGEASLTLPQLAYPIEVKELSANPSSVAN